MLSSQRASSPGHSGGWAGKVRRACNYVSGIWIPPPIPPSTELSVFCQSVQRGSECRCKQRLKNMWKHVPRVDTLVMSSLPISILHWLFQCRYSNSRNVVASSPSFSHPTARSPACLQATFFMISSCVQKVASTDNCPFPSRNADKWSSVRVQFQQTT